MVPVRWGAGQRRGGPQFGRKQGRCEADQSELDRGCKVSADLQGISVARFCSCVSGAGGRGRGTG